MEFEAVKITGKTSNKWKGYMKSTTKISGGRYMAKCNFCGKEFHGRVLQLSSHAYECKKFDKTLLSDEGPPPKRAKHSDNNSQLLITKYVQKQAAVQEDEANLLMLQALISTSTPFTWLNNPCVRKFLDYVKLSFIHKRDKMRHLVLPKFVNEVRQLQKSSLKSVNNLNVVLDGWTDVSKNYFMSVILIRNGISHYIGNLELSGQRYTSINMNNALKQLLSETLDNNFNNITSIVSDSANAMLKLRDIFCKEYKQVFNISCVLHTLNLISRDTINSPGMTRIHKQATKFSNFFKNSHIWVEKLKEWASLNKIPGAIESYSETRWFSFFSMCKSIVNLRDGFKNIFDKNTSQGQENLKTLPKDIKLFVQDITFFAKIESCCSFFEELVTTIKQLERDTASIVDIWPCIIKLYSFYARLREEVPADFKDILESFLKQINIRSKVYLEDIYILAFFLNPNYRQMAISKHFQITNIKIILRQMAKDRNLTLGEARLLLKLAEQYSEGDGEFRSQEGNSIKFWGSMPDSPLKQIAQSVLNTLPHSASCERLFSRMSYIKDKYQNRMSPETLTGLTQCKLYLHSLLKNDETLDDPDDLDYPNGDEVIDLIDNFTELPDPEIEPHEQMPKLLTTFCLLPPTHAERFASIKSINDCFNISLNCFIPKPSQQAEKNIVVVKNWSLDDIVI